MSLERTSQAARHVWILPGALVQMGTDRNSSCPNKASLKQLSSAALVSHVPDYSSSGAVPVPQPRYQHGLWPGWKPTDGQSQSPCDPINSGPLGSPGPQWLHHHLLLSERPLRDRGPSSSMILKEPTLAMRPRLILPKTPPVPANSPFLQE